MGEWGAGKTKGRRHQNVARRRAQIRRTRRSLKSQFRGASCGIIYEEAFGISQLRNVCVLTASRTMGIKEWSLPQISEH